MTPSDTPASAVKGEAVARERISIRNYILKAHKAFVARHGSRFIPSSEYFDAIADAIQPQPSQQAGAEGDALIERLCTAMQDGVGCTPWESRTWDRDDGVSRGLVRDSVRRILAALTSESKG